MLAQIEADSVQDQLDRLVARLEELDSQQNLEISSEKTNKTIQMTPKEITMEEDKLIHPDREC